MLQRKLRKQRQRPRRQRRQLHCQRPKKHRSQSEWFDRHCGLLICARVFDVLHPSRVPKAEEPTFDDFGVQQVRGLLEIYGKDIEKGGQRYPALLSDSTLPQYEVYKKLVWERGWGGATGKEHRTQGREWMGGGSDKGL